MDEEKEQKEGAREDGKEEEEKKELEGEAASMVTTVCQ